MFPARTSGSYRRFAVLVEVADGEVEHFQCGLLGGDQERAVRAAGEPVSRRGPISTKPNKQPTSLSVEDVKTIRAWFSADKKATDRDLPDLVAFMLGTGLRIGEACAVCWPDVDLQDRTVAVRGTVLFAAVRPRIPVRTAKQFHQLDVTGELRADVHRAVAALRERRERAPHAEQRARPRPAACSST